MLLGACGTPQPTAATLAGEPILSPLPGEAELADVRVRPRRSRVGVPGRDGVVERVVAVALTPSATADLVMQRHADRYGLRRVDLGRSASTVTVELRGTAPTGATVIVTASSTSPVPLYGGPDEIRPVPPDLVTSVVTTVISVQ